MLKYLKMIIFSKYKFQLKYLVPNRKPNILFILKYIDICRYFLFVVPSRWFIGGKGLDKFRIFMMNRHDIKLLIHQSDSKLWFGRSINIAGGVNYFLKDSEYNGPCLFDGHLYHFNKYDLIIHPKYHSIIDKMMSSGYQYLSNIYKGRYFGIETNDHKLKSNGNIKCYVSYKKNKDRIMYLDNYDFKPEDRFWKVITTRTSAITGKDAGFGYTLIGNPDEVHTGSYISFRVESEEEAESLKSYLSCKLPNYLLLVRKISQDISEKTCMWIPLVPLNREWNDEDLYEYFHFTTEEIQMIESVWSEYIENENE